MLNWNMLKWHIYQSLLSDTLITFMDTFMIVVCIIETIFVNKVLLKTNVLTKTFL